MRSSITSRGQTVVPAEIRRRFNLSPSDGLEWIVENNIIKVIPVRRNPIEAFRGRGRGGSVANLLKDRREDAQRE